MIRLQSLTIKSKFKNLLNITIDFQKCNGITVLIGNNGSGKSNIIEALSSIFAGLYNNYFNPDFSYNISYTKNDAPIEIKYDHTKLKNKYQYSLSDTKDFLPSQIISIYSGEELRLWNRYYFKFYDDFTKDVINSKKSFSEKQKMDFINKYHWNIALLTMIMSDLDVSDILGDKKIEKVVLEFNKPNQINIEKFNKQNPNDVTRFVQLLIENGAIDKTNNEKRIYTIDALRNIVLETHTNLFKLLSIAILPKDESWKLINKLELFLTDGYSTEELSEGEKKQILIKFITVIYADENSLLLMDEPDCHIHISNKESIKQLLYDIDNKAHVQSVLTTHSPTLTNCFNNENVYMLINRNGKIEIEDKTKQEIINDLTSDFWNLQEQNIFLSTNKKLILLVEGRHDKIHIQNALVLFKDDFPDLAFEVFTLEGESNIGPMLRGLRDAQLKNGKIYIGLYDNDKAGQDSLRKTGFDTDKNNCGFRILRQNGYVHKNFYGLLLPKPEEHKEDCTIENMFPATKYEEAYKEALTQTIGHFSNKSIDAISKDIKEKSKNILAVNSKDFTKDDYAYFKKLLELILEIEKQSNTKIEPPQEISKETPSEQKPIIVKRTVAPKEKSKLISLEKKEPAKMLRTKLPEKKMTTHSKKLPILEFRDEVFHIKQQGLLAEGLLSKKGNKFLLLEGSELVKEITNIKSDTFRKYRFDKIQSIKYTESDNAYKILENIILETPSTASKFVNSPNFNGWLAWKNMVGKTLDEIYRRTKKK